MKDIAIITFFLAPVFLCCDWLLVGILTYIVCGVAGCIAWWKSIGDDGPGGPPYWWWGGV